MVIYGLFGAIYDIYLHLSSRKLHKALWEGASSGHSEEEAQPKHGGARELGRTGPKGLGISIYI